MTEKELDVLEALYRVRPTQPGSSWARPMDVGGSDGSHHSDTLQRLARGGWVMTKKIHAMHCMNGVTQRQKLVGFRWVVTDGHPPYEGCSCKGHRRYRISPRALLFCFERIE